MRFFDYPDFLVRQIIELIDKLVAFLIRGFYLALKQQSIGLSFYGGEVLMEGKHLRGQAFDITLHIVPFIATL